MSSSSSSGPDFQSLGIIPSTAYIAGFTTIKEADDIAAALRTQIQPGYGYDVLTFAAGQYYVLLVTPDTVS